MSETKKNSMGERIFWLIVCGILLITNIYFYNTASVNIKKTDDAQIELGVCAAMLDDCASEKDDFEEKYIRYERLVSRTRNSPFGYPTLTKEEINLLQSKGLEDPIVDLAMDLKRQKDLIKMKPQSGRDFQFRSGDQAVSILGPNRAMGVFTDGSVQGYLLLSYKVSDNGKITWKVIEEDKM